MNKILLIAVLLSTSCQTCLADVSTATTSKRSAKADSTESSKVRDWFKQYDQIRRDAEMSRAEKFSIGPTLKKGISITSTEQERQRAKDIASRMVSRYGEASAKLAKLEAPAQTRKLHEGYAKYFADAKSLFETYLKAQEDIIKTGVKEGAECTNKRKALESLDHVNKDLDRQLRAQYHIPSHGRNH